jgi:RNA polymerase sigma-70 factor, ECF subfamily
VRQATAAALSQPAVRTYSCSNGPEVSRALYRPGGVSVKGVQQAYGLMIAVTAEWERLVILCDAEPDPVVWPEDAGPDVAWLDPVPDTLAIPEAADPAVIVTARESLRLALIASLQYLPPRQRAVLVLRDVLEFPAAQVAVTLDTTTASVKSALQRARGRLEEVASAADQITEPDLPQARALLDEYIAAFENADTAALERLLVEDVILEATPLRSWFSGRRACIPFLRDRVLGAAGDWRMLATGANGQPAAAVYARDADGHLQPYGVCVLTVTDRGVSRVTSFGNPGLLAVFGFPGGALAAEGTPRP